MEHFSIVPCRVEDVDRIREIQKKVWLATYPNKENGITKEAILEYFQDKEKTTKWINNVKKALEHKESRGWIAKINNQIVGYSFARKMGDKNRIMSVYILPGHQRQGIGKRLMEEMLQWLTEKPIVLEVATYNKDAIRFYESFGFVENGSTQNDIAALSSGVVIPEIEMIKEN